MGYVLGFIYILIVLFLGWVYLVFTIIYYIDVIGVYRCI